MSSLIFLFDVLIFWHLLKILDWAGPRFYKWLWNRFILLTDRPVTIPNISVLAWVLISGWIIFIVLGFAILGHK